MAITLKRRTFGQPVAETADNSTEKPGAITLQRRTFAPKPLIQDQAAGVDLNAAELESGRIQEAEAKKKASLMQGIAQKVQEMAKLNPVNWTAQQTVDFFKKKPPQNPEAQAKANAAIEIKKRQEQEMTKRMLPPEPQAAESIDEGEPNFKQFLNFSGEKAGQFLGGMAEELPFGRVERALGSAGERLPQLKFFTDLVTQAHPAIQQSGILRELAEGSEGIERKVGNAVGSLGTLATIGAATAPIAGATAASPVFNLLPKFQSIARLVGARMAQTGATFGLEQLTRSLNEAAEKEGDPDLPQIGVEILKATATGTGLGAVGSIAHPAFRIPAEAAYGFGVAKLEGASTLDAGLNGALFGLFGLFNRKNLSKEYKLSALIGLRQAILEQWQKAGAPKEQAQAFIDQGVQFLAAKLMKDKNIRPQDIDDFARELVKRAPVNKMTDITKQKSEVGHEAAKKFKEEMRVVKKRTPGGFKEEFADNINLENLDINVREKKTLLAAVRALEPELSALKGQKLTNAEVIAAAKQSEMLQQVTTREQVLQSEAALLKTRQRMVELDKEISQLAKEGKAERVQAKTEEFLEAIRVVSSAASERGRGLQALKIEASEETLRQQVLRTISKIESDTKKIAEASLKVDWDNALSVTKFYRQFIKPTFVEILTEYRYNNMLSSPKTHLRNAFSNVIQTIFTRPLVVAATYGPKESLAYYKGLVTAFPEAARNFRDAMKGKTLIEKPDLDYLPTLAIPRWFTTPARAMEAADRYFTTLIKSAEMARGATEKDALETAAYSLFRAPLDPTGKNQGYVLAKMDQFTEAAYQLRNVGLGWFIPFVRTPMAFAKQWLEFSPAGLATLPKTPKNKMREQVAKLIIGSAVSMMGGYKAVNDDTTWSAPKDPKAKQLFYASGKRPYSVRFGNTWVPMQYFGVFAFALALPAAIKHYSTEAPNALTDNTLQKIGKVTGSMAELFSQQTFLSGLGGFVNTAMGDQDSSVMKSLSFTSQQVIPWQALVRYVTQTVDPIFRNPKTLAEQYKVSLPGLSQQVPAHREPGGEPARRHPLSSILPYDVGAEKPEANESLKLRNLKLQQNAIKNTAEKQIARIQENTALSDAQKEKASAEVWRKVEQQVKKLGAKLSSAGD